MRTILSPDIFYYFVINFREYEDRLFFWTQFIRKTSLELHIKFQLPMTRSFEMALLQKWPSNKNCHHKTAYFRVFWLCEVITEKVYRSHKKSFVTLKDQYVSYKLLFSLLLYHQYFSSYDFWLHFRLLCTWDLQPCHIHVCVSVCVCVCVCVCVECVCVWVCVLTSTYIPN